MNVITSNPVARRGLMGALLAAGASGLSVAPGAGLASAPQPQQLPEPAAVEASRQRLRQLRTPNVPLLDHNGRSVRFYDDVMKGRTVEIGRASCRERVLASV